MLEESLLTAAAHSPVRPDDVIVEEEKDEEMELARYGTVSLPPPPPSLTTVISQLIEPVVDCLSSRIP